MTTPRSRLDRAPGDIALLATGVDVRAEARPDRPERALVDGVDVEARVGRTLVIVGESGAGKSMLARALTGLLPTGVAASGAMCLGGASIDLARAHTQLDGLRGSGIVWLPQDPFTSLSPTHRCGDQILALFEQVNREYGCTIVIVTHNAAIKRMAHRILRLRDGELVENEINHMPIPR